MKIKPFVSVSLLAAVVLLCACYAIGVWPFEPELELSHQRYDAVKTAIKLAPDGSVIVFGDSIVEGAPLPKTICERPIINAGVAGAAIGYFERHATDLLGSAHPQLIVLAVGINNASSKAAKQFQSHYDETVARLGRTASVSVATVTPVRPGTGSIGYDGALVPLFNAAIRAASGTTSVIDLTTPLSGANYTTDGIHFGGAGYSRWTGALTDGIAHILGCSVNTKAN